MKVALVEAARLDLMASKQKLEEDIRVKKNSIAIDQVLIRLHIPKLCTGKERVYSDPGTW